MRNQLEFLLGVFVFSLLVVGFLALVAGNYDKRFKELNSITETIYR